MSFRSTDIKGRKVMRGLALISRYEKIAVGLIFFFIFCLSINSVYAQNVANTVNNRGLSDNYEKKDSDGVLADSFGNQLSLSTDIIEKEYPELFIAESGSSSKKLTRKSGASAGRGDWYFSIAPYAWLLALDGTIGVKGQTADVNMSFGDLFDQAEFAGQLHAELFYRDKYGIFIDGTYVKLNTDSVMGPIVANTTTKIFMLEFAGIYRVLNTPTKYGQSQGYKKTSVIVDLLLGGRYYNIDNKINFRSEGPINLPSVSGDAGWFDFMAGGRIIWQATDRWSLIGRTDFGGFDFNFSSDFSWNGVGFVGFDATDWLQILLGFRAMYTDYSDGSGDNRFVFDTWMYGPVIGLNFHN
jgi:hypothetical protein